jgi:hypothetical protein
VEKKKKEYYSFGRWQNCLYIGLFGCKVFFGVLRKYYDTEKYFGFVGQLGVWIQQIL